MTPSSDPALPGAGGPDRPGPPTEEPAQSWAANRREATAAQAERLDRERRRQTAAARDLIAAFVQTMRERGSPGERLSATGYDGRGHYRTGTRGWYLRRNDSVAVGTDGEFYVLVVEGGVRSRLLGARLHPSDPPLVLGLGGRDGESLALEDALRLALDRYPGTTTP